MAAIESITSRLKTYKKPPNNGVVFFVGHVAIGSNQTEMVQIAVEPPMPISTFLYRCDSKFYIDPLEDMLVDNETFGLIVIDRGEATIGLLRGKRVDVIKNIPSRVPSKHGRGGQSQRRFERLIEIAAHEFFKKVGDIVNEKLLEETELKGILVGGPGSTKNFFVDKNYLHHDLKRKVIDLFDTGYTDEYGLRELVQNAAGALTDLDLMHEKRLMQKFMNEIRKKEGGLSIYGEENVMKALKNGVIDTLLISESLRMLKNSYHCSSCDYLLNEFVQDKPKTHQNKNENKMKICPKCDSHMTIKSSEDIIEILSKMADDVGTNVELISPDSSEGDMLLRAFGGIAGILRFHVAG